MSPCNRIMEAWATNETNQKNKIVPNKISGYASVKEYLRVHYNLLLEDFLHPLKQDLEILKNVKIETDYQVSFHLYDLTLEIILSFRIINQTRGLS